MFSLSCRVLRILYSSHYLVKFLGPCNVNFIILQSSSYDLVQLLLSGRKDWFVEVVSVHIKAAQTLKGQTTNKAIIIPSLVCVNLLLKATDLAWI
jgi:hypothetical protein